MVDVRFPVADGDTGRLWTLRLERVPGRPGLWRHPENAHIEVAPSFEAALRDAWSWAEQQDSNASEASVRWRLIHEGGDPRATGGSAGAAAAIGFTYLLGLTRLRRPVDQRSAVSATVTADGLLGSVDQLPAKLERGGRDWRRLIVSRQDEKAASDARQGNRPQVTAAADVFEGARLMARPWKLRAGLAAFTALVILVGGLTSYLIQNAATAQSAAQASQLHARAHQLAALASGMASRDPAAALRLAAAAYMTDKTSQDADAALIQTAQADSRIKSFLGADGGPAITRLATSSSEDLAVSADATGAVRSWQPACGGCQPATLSRGQAVNALAVAPGGSLVAVARGTSIAVISPTGQHVLGWPDGGLHVTGGIVDTLAINADASQIAVGTSYDEVYVWTRGTVGYQKAAIGTGAVVSAAVFLPDGRLVTGTAAKTGTGRQDLSAWRTTAGHLARTVLKPPPAPSSLFDPGVRALAVVGNSLVIGETYLQVRPLGSLNSARTFPVTDAVDALVPAGRTRVLVGTTPSLTLTAPQVGGIVPTMATTFTDTSLASGQPVDAPFSSGLTCLVPAVAAGPGNTMLAGTMSGTIVRWLPAQPSAPQIARITADPLDPSGIVATRFDGSVVALDAASGRMTSVISEHQRGPALGLAVDGATLFAGYTDGTVLRVSRNPAGAPVPLLHLPEKILTLAYSAKGNMLAVGGTSGTIGLYDAASGALIRTLPHPHHGNVYAIAFSPDGALVASSDVKDQVLVQSVNGQQTQSVPILSAGFLAWQGNGTLLAGNGLGDLYRLRLPLPARAPEPIADPGSTNILGGSLDPAGRYLALASVGQEAELLDSGTGQVVGRFPTLDGTRTGGPGSFAAAAWAVSFTRNGRYAVFGTTQGHLQVITVDLPVLAATACAMTPSPPVASANLSGTSLQAAEVACR